MAPKILFISRKWAPAVGGMETYSVELVGQLKRQAHVDAVVLQGNADGSAPRGLALVGFALKALAASLTLAKDHDIIHLGDAAIWPLGIVAKLGRKRAKVVLSAHGTDISYHRRANLRGRFYRAYQKLGSTLGKRWRVVANSRATARAAEEIGWSRAAVIPLATSLVPKSDPKNHGRHLLYAGRIIPMKGLSWFVREVMPLLPEDTELHVAGPVWNEAEGEVLACERVRYLGILTRQQLDEAYSGALGVVLPNIAMPTGEFEGFGLVAVEAAAAGGLVLAADRDGLSDAVRNGETGFLLPSGDGESWARKIGEIRGWDDGSRRTFVDRASEAALAYFNWPRVASDTMTQYREVIGEQLPEGAVTSA